MINQLAHSSSPLANQNMPMKWFDRTSSGTIYPIPVSSLRVMLSLLHALSAKDLDIWQCTVDRLRDVATAVEAVTNQRIA